MQSHFGRDYGFLGLLAETNTETGHDFIALEKFFWHSQFLSAVKRCKMWIELFRNSNNTPSWKGHLTRNLELMSGKGGKKKSRYTVDHFRCHSLKLQIPSTRSVDHSVRLIKTWSSWNVFIWRSFFNCKCKALPGRGTPHQRLFLRKFVDFVAFPDTFGQYPNSVWMSLLYWKLAKR